jgi:hypothetical protein
MDDQISKNGGSASPSSSTVSENSSNVNGFTGDELSLTQFCHNLNNHLVLFA